MKNYINGNDLEDIFNTEITNAVNVFWPFPDRKASTTVNQPDRNGQQIDLQAPTFDPRTFTLNCCMSSGSISSLGTLYWGLFQLIKVKGFYSLYNDYVDMTLQVFFTKQQNLTSPYHNSKGGISIKFDLIFGEGNPFANIPVVFLVDDQNRFLVP